MNSPRAHIRLRVMSLRSWFSSDLLATLCLCTKVITVKPYDRRALCRFDQRGLLFLGVVLCLGQNARADLPQAKEFYERDYAIAPGVAGQGGGAQARPRPRATRASHNGDSRSAVGGMVEPADSSSARGKKRKLLVSVTVSSSDQKHFLAVIDSIKRLNDSRLAFVTSVTHIGDYRSVTPDIENELAKRGISLSEGFVLPQQNPPPLSPMWNIRTRDGWHIAEGYVSIEQFVNEYGEYDPKHRAQSSEKPEVKVEGF